MSCDTFSLEQAQKLLDGKIVHMFGDSTIRALYKDLVWLLEYGNLISMNSLKRKNEVSHANDTRLSNGVLHSGRNYEEIRSYRGGCSIYYQFLTRLYLPQFIETIEKINVQPDIILINSGLWDLTRWGTNGVESFKVNLARTFRFLRDNLPSTRIIWLTTMPPSFTSRGGFYKRELEFFRSMLPWHVSFANQFAAKLAFRQNVDVLDFHAHLRYLFDYHEKDGIHWLPAPVRYCTNRILTHIALAWNQPLPGVCQVPSDYVDRSENIYNNPAVNLAANLNAVNLNTSNNQNRAMEFTAVAGMGPVVKLTKKTRRAKKRRSPWTNNSEPGYNFQAHSADNWYEENNYNRYGENYYNRYGENNYNRYDYAPSQRYVYTQSQDWQAPMHTSRYGHSNYSEWQNDDYDPNFNDNFNRNKRRRYY